MVPRFRLIAFWIDELKRCFSPKAITDTLEHLPMSLNGMYALMVSKIDLNHLTYARAIMWWLLFSVRQLKLEGIATVVGFECSDGRPAFNKDRCFGHLKAVLDVCGGLVVMSQGTAFCNAIRYFLIHAADGVTLAHLTFRFREMGLPKLDRNTINTWSPRCDTVQVWQHCAPPCI
jgi:hypothetical protein